MGQGMCSKLYHFWQLFPDFCTFRAGLDLLLFFFMYFFLGGGIQSVSGECYLNSIPTWDVPNFSPLFVSIFLLFFLLTFKYICYFVETCIVNLWGKDDCNILQYNTADDRAKQGYTTCSYAAKLTLVPGGQCGKCLVKRAPLFVPTPHKRVCTVASTPW